MTMRYLQSFPEDTSTFVSELWHGLKWSTSSICATKMVRHNHRDFFVEEFAELQNGAWVRIDVR